MTCVLSDGLVLPPAEKSEADYRAKIARGEVRELAFVGMVSAAEVSRIYGPQAPGRITYTFWPTEDTP